MPLYEYECEACHQRFEVIQKFSDPTPEICARCGKGPVRRLISTPAIQFKGSGWYITDYAGGRSNSASSTSAGDSDGKRESKGDGKSDAPGDSKKDGDKKPAGESSTTKSDTSSSSATSSTTTKD
jgi:putative FmdB family regulatory protein